VVPLDVQDALALATIVGTRAWPPTFTAVRPMSRIGSMARSEPTTETSATSRWSVIVRSTPKNCATKIAATAG
jgi:hypothetical protein